MTQTAPAPGAAPAAPIPAGGLSIPDGAARLKALRQAALAGAASPALNVIQGGGQQPSRDEPPQAPPQPHDPPPPVADPPPEQPEQPQGDEPEAQPEAAEGEDYLVDVGEGDPVALADLVASHREAAELRDRLARIESGEEEHPAVAEAKAEIEQQRATFQEHQQQLAQYVQGLRQIEEQASERLQRYGTALDQLGQVLQRSGERWRSWDYNRRRAEDPVAAAEELHQYREWEQAERSLQGEREKLAEEQRKAVAAEVYHRQQDLKLAIPTLFPQWAKPEARQADLERMNATGKALGFSDDELTYTFDPRVWKLLHEAAEYRRITSGKEALVSQKPDAKPAPPPPRIKVVSPRGAAPRGSPQAVANGRVGGLQQAFNQDRGLLSGAKLLRAKREMAAINGRR